MSVYPFEHLPKIDWWKDGENGPSVLHIVFTLDYRIGKTSYSELKPYSLP